MLMTSVNLDAEATEISADEFNDDMITIEYNIKEEDEDCEQST